MLALQGAFRRHLEALRRVGADAAEVRRPADLDGLDALVIPGGESTTIAKLLVSGGLREPIADRIAAGMPVLGTCAGLIMLAGRVADGAADQWGFSVLDVSVRRNGFGRQVDSFEADLAVSSLGEVPLRAVFIRAPVIERVGPDVDVLATLDGAAVLVRQGPLVACSFHPELTADDRLHAYFAGDVVAPVLR